LSVSFWAFGTCSRFHKHFIFYFFADILAQKNYQANVSAFVIFGAKILYEKGMHKMLMKLTPACIKAACAMLVKSTPDDGKSCDDKEPNMKKLLYTK